MQFSKLDEIRGKGFDAAQKMLEKWQEEGKLSRVLEDWVEERGTKGMKRGKSARRNSI